MKFARHLLASGSGLVAAGAVFVYACHADRDISTDILIHGSPRAVWQVLTATGEYPAWNPMIARISGDLREGNVIEVDEGMVFHPKILAYRVDQELRWMGHVLIPGIFDGEHRFWLEVRGDDTRLVQSEKFTGIFAGRISRGIIDETIDSMDEMNRALKSRVESSGRPNKVR